MSEAWKAYREATGSAWEAKEEAIASAWDDYDEAVASLWKAYAWREKEMSDALARKTRKTFAEEIASALKAYRKRGRPHGRPTRKR